MGTELDAQLSSKKQQEQMYYMRDMANCLRSLLRHCERMQEALESAGLWWHDEGPTEWARRALEFADKLRAEASGRDPVRPAAVGARGAAMTPEDIARVAHPEASPQASHEFWMPQQVAEAIRLHEVGSAYAHRLAIMLECALLNPMGTWEDGHALLDEYRAACRAAAPSNDPPTFMGEPVDRPHAALGDDNERRTP
jgi:hypothetical protein